MRLGYDPFAPTPGGADSVRVNRRIHPFLAGGFLLGGNTPPLIPTLSLRFSRAFVRPEEVEALRLAYPEISEWDRPQMMSLLLSFRIRIR